MLYLNYDARWHLLLIYRQEERAIRTSLRRVRHIGGEIELI